MSEGLHICKALAVMFKESDEMTEEAINFVAMTALQVGLSEQENSEVQQALKEGGDYKSSLKSIESKTGRGLFLRRMLAAVLLDEEISEKEQGLIDQALQTFDVSLQQGAELIAWTRVGLDVEKKLVSLLAKV
ncbi:MAG: hypothetical protein JRH20_10035 [Deltaproteobacteria bacterium]|nr:hypothetical protein [Deltaproteobacteria bacterium]